MALSLETYRELYEKLDTVGPVPFDCGMLCGKACCGVSEYERPVEDDSMGMYLFPGEEAFQKQDPDWLYWNNETVLQEDVAPEGAFPQELLGHTLCFVKCRAPLHCHREHRPLQCRMFPVLPHLLNPGTNRERLVLIWNDMDLPYFCPLIEEETEPDTDWLRAVYEVWTVLLQDADIRAMTVKESIDRWEDIGLPTVLYPKHQTSLN